MAFLMVPALAACAPRAAEVRVAFDAKGVTQVRAAGLADRATGRRVTADDPVRVASISKLVVALGVMRMVEAGTLDLDRDVSDWLGWKLRHPRFPDRPITLRLLLSHRAGLSDGGELYLIPLGDTLRERLADARAWDADHAPGNWFGYANIGFPVIASVMEKASGERFDRLMMRLVFQPLKLDACYNWSGCSAAKTARAVVLYRANGDVARDDLHGRPPPCLVMTRPGDAGCDLSGYRLGDNGALFSPQGGMRISMRDLAAIGAMLLRGGDGFLKRASIAEIEGVAWTFDGANGMTGESTLGSICRYGLAVQTIPTMRPGCADDLFADGRAHVGHQGEAYALRSGLWLDRASGTGVAFFATAVPDDSRGASAFSREEERLAREK